MCYCYFSYDVFCIVCDVFAVDDIIERLRALTIERAPTTVQQPYDLSSPQMSYAEIAKLHTLALKKISLSFAMPSSYDGDPICSLDKLRELKASRLSALENCNPSDKSTVSHESYLCYQMTPILCLVFVDIGVVVNSEDYKWIETYSRDKINFMKPDFFVAARGLVVGKESSGSDFLQRLRPDDYHFGTMIWAVRDCMRVVIEFKNKISPEDFGKLIIYLQHLSRDSPDCTYFGMLCDDTRIILASCRDLSIRVRYDLEWSSPGSMQFVRDFVSPKNDWLCLLDLCIQRLEVELDRDGAFLGSGAHGRVFRVRSTSVPQQVQALKIVLTKGDESKACSVFDEARTLLTLKGKHAPVVTLLQDAVGIYPDDQDECFGVCYLMSEVGTPVNLPNKRSTVISDLYMSLRALHIKDQFHGDARVDNVMEYEGSYLWCDFFRPHHRERATMKVNFVADIHKLTASILQRCEKHDVHPDIVLKSSVYADLVDAYGDTLLEDALAGVVEIVTNIFWNVSEPYVRIE